MSEHLILYGAHYSVYTRIVHGALLMKGAPFSFQEIDVFDTKGKTQAINLGNPFGKIPILEHNSKIYYETRAILAYLEHEFGKLSLFPAGTNQRIVSEQLISIADNYLYPDLVWKIYVPFSDGKIEQVTDEVIQRSRQCLQAVEQLLDKPWACGEQLRAADLYLEANLKLYLKTPFAAEMLQGCTQVSMSYSSAIKLPTSLKAYHLKNDTRFCGFFYIYQDACQKSN